MVAGKKTARAPRPIKVLIIDDERDFVAMLRMRFDIAGSFEIETAYDGEEGLAKARSFQPDVVLLDLIMPKADGWEVCRRLRLDPGGAHIPVVMMTAHRWAAGEAPAHPPGVHRVVFKPLDPGVLVKTLLDAVPRPV